MLKRDKNLSFLKRKIEEIQLAMFKAETDPMVQLPNNIITTLRTDSEGYIWFYTSYKGDITKNVSGSFPASLEFYKKGSDCRLLTNGQASVIKEGLVETNSGKVLIRFRIMHARCFENRDHPYTSLITKLKYFVSGVFPMYHYREFYFPESAILIS